MIGDIFRTGGEVFEALLAAKEQWSAHFLQGQPLPSATRAAAAAGAMAHQLDDNIIGIGIGEKIVQGLPLGLPALKIFVREKRTLAIPFQFDFLPRPAGLLIDVEEIGDLRGLIGHFPDPRVQARPAQPGCSIGIELDPALPPTAGTLGAIVTRDGEMFLLSNNHVFASQGRHQIGTSVFQPAPLDATAGHRSSIAKLSRVIDLRLGFMNRIDAALARVNDPALIKREILALGLPQGVARIAQDMVVHKFGRTTSYRAGRVTSINTDVKVRYENGEYLLGGQIIIQGLNGQRFSEAGDSGALILDRASGAAVGLLCAGSRTHSIANHVSEVFATLGVTFA